MTQTRKRTGSCLCGDVKITAQAASLHVGACHCDMCRRWGGGPFIEIDCGDAVSFDGESSISIYDSSAWAERGFCKRCGTHLFYRIKQHHQHMLPAGLIDDQSNLHFEMQVFIDHKPAYYTFADDTKTMTETQVFEMFGGDSDGEL